MADTLALESPHWLRPAVVGALAAPREGRGAAPAGFDAVSLGCGPGFDLPALALVKPLLRLSADGADRTLLGQSGVRVLALDYEARWETEVGAVVAATRSALGLRHSAAFGRCDITLPLAAPANELVEEALAGGTRLFVASYVVAENAVALRDSEFVFFEELFARAPAGTLLLVLETTHRQFPAIARAAWRGGGDAVAAACPRVRSNRGYSLCLLKRSAAPAGVEGGEADAFGPESEELSELFSRFEEDDRRQRRKALDEESVG